RAFTYDAQHPGRMVAHRYAGRPEMRYRYDDAGRVVEQLNPAGLSYRYQYEQDRITVTDSVSGNAEAERGRELSEEDS
ncbi:RHS repeat domain-containing protein, partial [Vibrio cholerae]|uniref:RHS repeat domain-containing protein n=1 Tax=Vibrio cholerae TaxID=666 RepID=UPI001C0FD7DC